MVIRQSFLPVYALSLLLFGGMITPAQAYSGLDKFPELSYETTDSREAIFKRTEIHDEVPLNDASLAMQIRLPIGWMKIEKEEPELNMPLAPSISMNEKKKLPGEESSDPAAEAEAEAEDRAQGDMFTMLAHYITPPRMEGRSELRVRSIKVNSLISLKNWFITYTLQMGFSPEGVTQKSINRLEAQYTIFYKGEPMVVRAVMQQSGSKIILAEYMVHQDNYEKEKDEQVYCMTDFRLLSPNKDPAVALNVYVFIDIAKFSYPENWILYTPGVTTIDRMDASVINIRGVSATEVRKRMDDLLLNGRVDVTVVSKYSNTSLRREVGLVGDTIKKKGLVIGDKIEDVESKKEKLILHKKIMSFHLSKYKIARDTGVAKQFNSFAKTPSGTPKTADYEYWFSTMETEGRYYLIRLVTIGRDEDFKAWAENTAAFNNLLSSISPVNDNVR